MSNGGSLGRDAVALLLDLLEIDEPVIAGQAAALMPHVVGPLIQQGLLVEAGYDDVVSVETDGQEELVSLLSMGEDGSLGYLAPHAGFVKVPREQIIRRRVNIPAAIGMIVAALDVANSTPPFALADDLLWEIGDARIAARPERLSVWFARRFSNPDTRACVEAQMTRRPSGRIRVILTSSRPGGWEQVPLKGALVASVSDLLRRPEALAVHPEILDARLQGRSRPATAPDIDLSPDGTRLTILRQHVFVFRGAHQRKVVSHLVEAHKRGERVRAVDLTDLGSPSRVFGKAHWPRLSQFLKSGPGGWAFEV